MTDSQATGIPSGMKDEEVMVGDGYQIEPVRIRGWRCHIFTSLDPPFVTGNAVDDDHVRVFVDFEAEFGMDWDKHPQAKQYWGRASKIAYARLSDQIERVMEERRKRYRRR